MHDKATLRRAMNLDPNPIPSIELHRGPRKFFCVHYSSCLDTAIGNKWQGFSCSDCEAFAPTNWNAEDRTEDEFKCMALILTIFSQRRYAHISPGRIVERLERETRHHQEFGGVLSY